jgi:hypothetical protein
MSNQHILDLSSTALPPSTTAKRLQPRQLPTELEGSVSAAPILKSKPRIPIELQAVFLESCRTGTSRTPPSSKVGNKIFIQRWLSPGESKVAEDGTVCQGEIRTIQPHVRQCRRLSFGSNETIVFNKSEPADELHWKRPKCRWGLSRQDSMPELPSRIGNHDTIQFNKSVSPADELHL